MRLFLVILTWMSFLTATGAPKTISVVSFGAKGDGITDNCDAFTRAFQYCATNHYSCYIPRSERPYLISSSVRIDLRDHQQLFISSNNAIIALGNPSSFKGHLLWKLTPAFREIALFAVGQDGSSPEISDAFTRRRHNAVYIEGLQFDGSALPFSRQVSSNQTILSALDLAVDTVFLSKVTFTNIQGYGIRTYGASYLHFTHLRLSQVGGRGQVPNSDAFGDGIYISVLDSDARILIENCAIQGAEVSGRRSRDGITFEYSKQPYTVEISHCQIGGFAKSIHVEDHASALINVRQCHFSNFNYCLAMVANAKSVLNASDDTLLCSGTDGVDRGDGGPTINTHGGGIFRFYRSVIDLDGRRRAYITMVGVRLLQDCLIIGNDKNPYFADGNCIFDSCRFSGFGGSGYSFYAYGKNIARFSIANSHFTGGGTVHANGQRVNLSFSHSVSQFALTTQIFNNR